MIPQNFGIACISCVSCIAAAAPFTVQGQLRDNGSLADADYDFEFRLYDAATGGTQIGSVNVIDDISVVSGVFNASVNFGDVFDGASLYLETSVRVGTSTGSYTTLTDRTVVGTSPQAQYALLAESVENLEDIYVIGTIDATGDIEGADFQYVNPMERKKLVSFEQFEGTPSNRVFDNSEPAIISTINAFNNGILFASLSLPEGALITRVDFYYKDNTTQDMIGQIVAESIVSGSQTLLGSVTSSGSSVPIRVMSDTTIATHLVDNDSYIYFIYVNNSGSGWPTNTFFGIRSVVVTYEVGSPD